SLPHPLPRPRISPPGLARTGGLGAGQWGPISLPLPALLPPQGARAFQPPRQEQPHGLRALFHRPAWVNGAERGWEPARRQRAVPRRLRPRVHAPLAAPAGGPPSRFRPGLQPPGDEEPASVPPWVLGKVPAVPPEPPSDQRVR